VLTHLTVQTHDFCRSSFVEAIIWRLCTHISKILAATCRLWIEGAESIDDRIRSNSEGELCNVDKILVPVCFRRPRMWRTKKQEATILEADAIKEVGIAIQSDHCLSSLGCW
jgi:hypothetical protein